MRKKLLAWFAILGIPLTILGGYFWFFYSSEKTISTPEGVRRYRLHVPWSITSDQKVPLVIFFHGYSDNPRLSELYTGWSALADRKKFVVAYPYGTKSTEDPALSWNAGFCCATAVEKKIDDVGFVRSLIKELVSKYPVDEKKVYLSGFSNGALLSYRIVTESENNIRAVGIVAGAVGGRKNSSSDLYMLPTPSKPMNIIMFHGREDWLVPYEGGRSQIVADMGAPEFTSFTDAGDFWIRANKCNGLGAENEVGNSKIVKYKSCANNTAVEMWTVFGRNHEWTGGLLEYSIHGSISGPKTTEEIWRFFEDVSPN